MNSPSAGARYDFALNPGPEIGLHHVGAEREPVLVLDGALRDPAGLVELAAREARFEPPPGGRNFYPGVLAPAPLDYVSAMGRALDPLLREAFGLRSVALGRAVCNFSIVTLPPEQLNRAQRLPHVDTVDPLQFAFLHFLCDARFGGTAFYRHRSTGFEALTPERVERHQSALDAELERNPPPPGYVVGDTPQYEQTAAFEARFDRVLVYRSRVLHSGQINPLAGLSADPRQGRLTANIFLNYRPR